jgi:hypothetical protein
MSEVALPINSKLTGHIFSLFDDQETLIEHDYIQSREKSCRQYGADSNRQGLFV